MVEFISTVDAKESGAELVIQIYSIDPVLLRPDEKRRLISEITAKVEKNGQDSEVKIVVAHDSRDGLHNGTTDYSGDPSQRNRLVQGAIGCSGATDLEKLQVKDLLEAFLDRNLPKVKAVPVAASC